MGSFAQLVPFYSPADIQPKKGWSYIKAHIFDEPNTYIVLLVHKRLHLTNIFPILYYGL